MRLTNYTDYALRVLLITGASGQALTISKVSQSYDISKDHLRKVVHSLAQLGYLNTTQGRNGGFTLAKKPEQINLKTLVVELEPSELVECFNSETNTCPITQMCQLKSVLYKAQQNFLTTLSHYHLSDLIKDPDLVIFARG